MSEIDQQVTVIARARAKAGMEKLLREALQRVLAPTRAEAGCLNYDLHESATDPRDFVFYENWISQGDLDAHLKSPHIKALFESLPSLTEGQAEVTLWKMVR
jgi:quinol monooxygenase YgiN